MIKVNKVMAIIEVKKKSSETVTIEDALNKAESGDTILLEAGIYNVATLKINLQGIILRASKAGTVTINGHIKVTGSVILENLIVYSRDNAVSVRDSGSAKLINCSLSSGDERFPVIVVKNAKAILEKCKIHDTPSYGLLVHDEGVLDLIDCEIWGCGDVAIVAEDPKTNLNLINCLIRDTKEAGVMAIDQAMLKIENCEFKNCGKDNSAIYLNTRAQGFINKTKIHDTPTYGVLVNEEAGVELIDCELWGCGDNAIVAMDSKTNLKLINCLIRDTAKAGVFVAEKAKVKIEKSVFNNCGKKDPAIYLLTGAQGFIKQTKIHDTPSKGIYANEGSGVELVDCELWGCSDHAIVAEESNTKLKLTNCLIRDTDKAGVYVTDRAILKIENSEFRNFGKDEAAIWLEAGAQGFINKTKIHDTPTIGVLVNEGSVLELIDCELWGCSEGVIIAQNSNTKLKLTNCLIRDAEKFGVLAFEHAMLKIENSEFKNLGKDSPAILFLNGVEGFINKTKIHDTFNMGILVNEGSIVELIDCEFWGCGESAILAENTGTNLKLINCLIRDMEKVGVMACDQAILKIVNSEFKNCGENEAAVLLTTGAQGFISKTKIHDTPSYGILVIEEAGLELIDCELWGCGDSVISAQNSNTKLELTNCMVRDTKAAGVFVCDQAKLKIENSEFKNCGDDDPAICLSVGAKGVIKKSKIHDTPIVGIYVNEGGSVELIECELWGCGKYAIFAQDTDTNLEVNNCLIRDAERAGIFVGDQVTFTVQ